MNLKEIESKENIQEIFDYIIRESCYLSSINKNVDIQDRSIYNIQDYDIYLNNMSIGYNDDNTSLDILVCSNTKNYRNIHLSDREDSENHIQQARCDVYFLLYEYLEGKYNNETLREFGIEINNIDDLKKLFAVENVDRFVSHILVKCKQQERKTLSNRLVSSVKDEKGNWSTRIEYKTINFISFETNEDNSEILENFIFNSTEEETYENELDIKYNYNKDNIYGYLYENINELTDKQREFIKYMIKEDIVENDDNYYNRQLIASYYKNIRNRLEKRVLNNNSNVICKNGCYRLKKVQNIKVIYEIIEEENKIKQFIKIANVIKKDNNVSNLFNSIIIDSNLISYFTDYYKNNKITVNIRRFVVSKKFDNLIDKIKNIGD